MDLDQINDNYSQQRGYIDTEDLLTSLGNNTTELWICLDELQILAQKECLKRAAKKIESRCFTSQSDYIHTVIQVDNENNLIK